MKRIGLLAVCLLWTACGDATMPGADRHYMDVATGFEHTCAIAIDGDAYCWGQGEDGQLGTGDTLNRMFPTRVNTSLKFKQITAGTAHSCGIASDDFVHCWGWNWFYQIGDATRLRRAVPQPAAAFGNTFRQISAGAYHTCGVTYANEVRCWGYNRFGQTGIGSTDTTYFPVPVTGGLQASMVSAGAHHACALTLTGGIYCWGSNESGQLGIASDVAYVTEPTLVAAGGFVSVDAGDNHTCAVGVDARGYCWGSNEYGQLGDAGTWRNNLPGPSVPNPVFLLTNLVSISAGVNHTCALDRTGRVWCWGRGVYGQLGVGTINDQYVGQPVVVQPGIQNRTDYLSFTAIAAGGATHACGLGEDVVFCWGTGRSGQLGSRNTYVTIPQRVE